MTSRMARMFAAALLALLVMVPAAAGGGRGDVGSGGWVTVPRQGAPGEPRLYLVRSLGTGVRLELPAGMQSALVYVVGAQPGSYTTMVVRNGRLDLEPDVLTRLAEAGVRQVFLQIVAPGQPTLYATVEFDSAKRAYAVTVY